jgi:hypothetical protein
MISPKLGGKPLSEGGAGSSVSDEVPCTAPTEPLPDPWLSTLPHPQL